MAELTGRKVLTITVSAFAIIIAVNATLAWNAIATFPGLEVRNSYVASQSFDAERAAQEAMGWTLTAAYDVGALGLTFRDADGLPAPVRDLFVLVGRSTVARDDVRPAFLETGGTYTTDIDLAPGKWLLRVEATAPDGTVFRQRIDLVISAVTG